MDGSRSSKEGRWKEEKRDAGRIICFPSRGPCFYLTLIGITLTTLMAPYSDPVNRLRGLDAPMSRVRERVSSIPLIVMSISEIRSTRSALPVLQQSIRFFSRSFRVAASYLDAF